jgi:NAD(P)H-nitrite reductase large subunit
VLIGKETDLPYDRIKLSKAMTASVESILLRPESFYQERNIELLLGKEVTTHDTHDTHDTRTRTTAHTHTHTHQITCLPVGHVPTNT